MNIELSYFPYRQYLKDFLYNCSQRNKYYNQIITETSLIIQHTPVTPHNQHEISHQFYILHFYHALKESNLTQQKKYFKALSYLIS